MNTRGRKRPARAGKVQQDLYDQPGHLIRRAHQIALGLFTEYLGKEVTPVQYSILRMVHEVPEIDQMGLARRIGLDTSTTALTAARLESKGLLTRTIVESNRRQLKLALTPDGEAWLQSLVPGVHKMRQQMLAALDPQEQELFVHLLRKFVDVNNEQSRAPLQLTDAEKAGLRSAPKIASVAPARTSARTRRTA